MNPDERALREHLTSARFQAGVDRGDWELISLDWPHAVFAIAADPRPNAPAKFHVRFNLTGYPRACPTGTPWNTDTGAMLEPSARPLGERVGMVFRTDWNGGASLYAPYDRAALDSHGDWRTTHAAYAWNDTRDLSWLLNQIRELLSDEDYEGVRAA
jgi:hypothetical protein